MRDTLQARLDTLQKEYEAGRKMLAEIDAKRDQLTQTMLRIEGAIRVLQEALEAPAPESQP